MPDLIPYKPPSPELVQLIADIDRAHQDVVSALDCLLPATIDDGDLLLFGKSTWFFSASGDMQKIEWSEISDPLAWGSEGA